MTWIDDGRMAEVERCVGEWTLCGTVTVQPNGTWEGMIKVLLNEDDAWPKMLGSFDDKAVAKGAVELRMGELG